MFVRITRNLFLQTFPSRYNLWDSLDNVRMYEWRYQKACKTKFLVVRWSLWMSLANWFQVFHLLEQIRKCTMSCTYLRLVLRNYLQIIHVQRNTNGDGLTMNAPPVHVRISCLLIMKEMARSWRNSFLRLVSLRTKPAFHQRHSPERCFPQPTLSVAPNQWQGLSCNFLHLSDQTSSATSATLCATAPGCSNCNTRDSLTSQVSLRVTLETPASWISDN